MNKATRLGIIAILTLVGAACSSKSGLSRGPDGAADSQVGAGGALGVGGRTAGAGGGSGGIGAGGVATGAGGATGLGGTTSGGSGGRGGAGGGPGTGGAGTGGAAKDASPGDGPKDGATDAPAQPDGGPGQVDSALVCPAHLPVLPVYPYTPESCSTELTVSKLRCTYTAPLVGVDGGPACSQTFFCQCVSGQGGPPTCYWQANPNVVCPDAGTSPTDVAASDAPAGDAAAGPLCGGKVCAADEDCCGPAECGRCIKKLTGPNCPSQCSASFCGPAGAVCNPGEVCLDVLVSAGPAIGSATAKCVSNPCGSATLDCSCAGTLCADANSQTTCTTVDSATGLVHCLGGNKCAAPDTPIATPAGDRAIADLRPGDLVYSEHHGAIVAVPLVQVVRRPAAGHVVVHLVTARGAVLDISGPHPTADGRRFSDLNVGDLLDGDAIVAREVVPYAHAFTYDILPASSSGTYVAAGLLIGSTLTRAALPAMQAANR